MHRCAYLTLAVPLVLGAAFARADNCGDNRVAIDSYIAATDAGAAVDGALEAAKSGTRAARASRSAIGALTKDATLAIFDLAGALDALEAAACE